MNSRILQLSSLCSERLNYSRQAVCLTLCKFRGAALSLHVVDGCYWGINGLEVSIRTVSRDLGCTYKHGQDKLWPTTFQVSLPHLLHRSFSLSQLPLRRRSRIAWLVLGQLIRDLIITISGVLENACYCVSPEGKNNRKFS